MKVSASGSRVLLIVLALGLVVTALATFSGRPANAAPGLVPLDPGRAADTRNGTGGVPVGPVGAGEVLAVRVAGVLGVPQDASAVSLNVTAVYPSGYGFVTVYPCGQERPTASTLNFSAGTIANAAIAKPGTGGEVCLYVSQSTHLIVDVNGYFPAGSAYGPLVPVRAADTRNGTGGVPTGPVAAGQELQVRVAGAVGVPADAVAVSLNVTAVYPSGYGFVTVYPCGQERPTASTLNFSAGTIANAAIAQPGSGGRVCLFTSQATQLIVDVNGYFPAGAEYSPLDPGRAADTRNGTGGVPVGPVGAGEVLAVRVAGVLGVPQDASAVSMNVTAVYPSGYGFVTVYPCGQERPTASTLNFSAGTIANAAIAKPGTEGSVCLFTSQATQMIVDVNGYFPAPDRTPPGPVTDLRVTATTASSVSIAWRNPGDADLSQVIVRRAQGTVPPNSPAAGSSVSAGTPTATSLTDGGLSDKTAYAYAVFARDSSGNVSTAATITARTKDGTPPGRVTDLRSSKTTPTTITLSWANPTDPDLAEVIVRRGNGTAPPAGPTAGAAVGLASPLANTVTDTGLSPSTTYTYAVFTRDGSGNTNTQPVTVTQQTSPAPALRPETISAGANHTCALDFEGFGWCWGDNEAGQLGDGTTQGRAEPVAVAGGRALKAITVGWRHSCALDSAGVAWCWGSNLVGQLGTGAGEASPVPVAVAGGRTYSVLSSGNNHTCAVDGLGQAWCWGDNGYFGPLGDTTTIGRREPVPVVGDLRVQTVSAGGSHTCAVDLSGRAWCWGANDYGQLGTGSTSPSTSPVKVSTSRTLNQITAGDTYTCAVDTTGRAWCWGRNLEGQLGDGSTSSSRSIPVAVAGNRSFTVVEAGARHTCALDTGSAAWCWGQNFDGQLGDGGRVSKSAPSAVAGSGRYGWITAGADHSCATADDGRAMCWGYNGSGQLGDGSTQGRLTPTPTKPLQDATAPGPVTGLRIAGRTASSLTLSWANPEDADLAGIVVRRSAGATAPATPGDGTGVDLGTPQANAVADGPLAPNATYSYSVFTRDVAGNINPAPVSVTGTTASGTTQDALAVGSNHVCILDDEGAAWCWGSNSDGQLGDGTTSTRLAPVPVVGGHTFVQIGAGGTHTCAVDSAGAAWCWGSNASGGLGTGGNVPSTVPVPVAGGRIFTQVALGEDGHTCALDLQGAAWCWGDNWTGQLGDATTLDRSTPVAVAGGRIYRQVSAGDSSTCAVESNGQAWCWGANFSGQLGDGTTTDRFVPVAVKGSHDFQQIDAGWGHACGIDARGSAWCWGSNWSGQLGVGTTDVHTAPVPVAAGNLKRIDVGYAHTCALAASGAAKCWGMNWSGQVGDGTVNDRSMPVVVSGGRSYEAVAAGATTSCAIDTAGRAWCWGIWNGNGSDRDSTVPVPVARPDATAQVSAGEVHTCALDATGRAWCWGSNDYGQLGDGTTTGRSTPVAVAGDLRFRQIAAGHVHTCALDFSGTAWCWGDGAEFRLL